MTWNILLQYGLFFGVLLVLVKPLGSYMARVFQGERVWLDHVFGPVERLTYRVLRIDQIPVTLYIFEFCNFCFHGFLTYCTICT